MEYWVAEKRAAVVEPVRFRRLYDCSVVVSTARELVKVVPALPRITKVPAAEPGPTPSASLYAMKTFPLFRVVAEVYVVVADSKTVGATTWVPEALYMVYVPALTLP